MGHHLRSDGGDLNSNQGVFEIKLRGIWGQMEGDLSSLGGDLSSTGDDLGSNRGVIQGQIRVF